jgi:hypothetical protein
MAEMAAWWFHNRHRDRTDGVHRHGETLATPYDSKIPWIDYNGVKYHVEDVPLEV